MSRPTLIRTALATVAGVCALTGTLATPAAANPDHDPCFSNTHSGRSYPSVQYKPNGSDLTAIVSFESSGICGADLARAHVMTLNPYTLVIFLEGLQVSGWQRLDATTRVYSPASVGNVSGSWREARPILRACAEFNGDKICTAAA